MLCEANKNGTHELPHMGPAVLGFHGVSLVDRSFVCFPKRLEVPFMAVPITGTSEGWRWSAGCHRRALGLAPLLS